MIIRARIALALIAIMTLSTAAKPQERVLQKPGFTVGQESRYIITASVETALTPNGPKGIAGAFRRELTATVVMTTVGVGGNGEINQEAAVEAITFGSSSNVDGAAEPPGKGEAAGRKIEFTATSAGHLLKCTIPDSPGYLLVAELIFSLARWYPAGEVAVGGSWQAVGQGPIYADRLSPISKGATTAYRLGAVDKGIASIEGTVTLNESGVSGLNAGGFNKIGVIASGKGTTRFDFDVNAGRVIGGATESRMEGKVASVLPSAAGEKMQSREASLVEVSKFSIKLVP